MKLMPVFFAKSSDKQNFPNNEQLHNDLFHSMQKTKTNFGRELGRLSDIYKLLYCEKISSTEKEKGSCLIQFKGEIELQDTIYNYGNYGYKTYFMTSTLGQINYKGALKKGTIIPIAGKAEYKLTENGWEYGEHSVKLESDIVPTF